MVILTVNIIFVFSLGPKRASKIRKLFNLTKEDDVCQYVIKRPLPLKEVWTFPPFLSLAILLTIKSLFQWPSVLHHVNFIGSKFNCEFWFFQLWFKSFSMLKTMKEMIRIEQLKNVFPYYLIYPRKSGTLSMKGHFKL